jgi:integral membrane sensor domain MASE1
MMMIIIIIITTTTIIIIIIKQGKQMFLQDPPLNSGRSISHTKNTLQASRSSSPYGYATWRQ